MKNQPKTSRRKLNEVEGKPIREAKVSWVEALGINQIQLTESQHTLSNKIIENDLVFCEGPAGTGKTMAVLYTYTKEYLMDKTKQLVVIRTPVEAGTDKIGALPDTLEAKIEPHFASAKYLLTLLMSKGKVETDLGNRIHFKVPNFCLGATFDNSLILIDEAQQLPPLILKLLLERTGIGSKVVVCGDNTQLYSSGTRNALMDALPRFFDNTNGVMKSRYDSISYHKFGVEDVQRSSLVKSVIRAYA
jgi:phosphate starvation-inducible PhoH-like protein